DRTDHPSDQLLDAVLALRRADRAAEVLRRDDVGRELRPARRDLDVVLLEDDVAALAADHSAAPLPGLVRDRVGVGVAARGAAHRTRVARRGEAALELETARRTRVLRVLLGHVLRTPLVVRLAGAALG